MLVCFPLLFLCFDSLWKLCSRLRTRSFLSSFRKGVIFHMFEKYLFQPFEQFFFFLPLIENNIRIIFIELDESIFPFYAKMKETIGSRCREKFNFFYQRWQTKKNVIDFPSLYIISLPTITCLHFFFNSKLSFNFFFLNTLWPQMILFDTKISKAPISSNYLFHISNREFFLESSTNF